MIKDNNGGMTKVTSGNKPYGLHTGNSFNNQPANMTVI
jgi:hypothetical protein